MSHLWPWLLKVYYMGWYISIVTFNLPTGTQTDFAVHPRLCCSSLANAQRSGDQLSPPNNKGVHKGERNKHTKEPSDHTRATRTSWCASLFRLSFRWKLRQSTTSLCTRHSKQSWVRSSTSGSSEPLRRLLIPEAAWTSQATGMTPNPGFSLSSPGITVS